jgi:hypothetical protein
VWKDVFVDRVCRREVSRGEWSASDVSFERSKNQSERSETLALQATTPQTLEAVVGRPSARARESPLLPSRVYRRTDERYCECLHRTRQGSLSRGRRRQFRTNFLPGRAARRRTIFSADFLLGRRILAETTDGDQAELRDSAYVSFYRLFHAALP